MNKFLAFVLAMTCLVGCSHDDLSPVADPKASDITGGLTMGGKPAVLLGTKTPDFSALHLPDRMPFKMSELRGKVVLVDFWATWCIPCVKAFPQMEALYREFNSKGLEIVCISDEKAEIINAFVASTGCKLPMYQDQNKVVKPAFKIGGIPVTVLLDREGNMLGYFDGNRPENDKEIRAILKKLGIG